MLCISTRLHSGTDQLLSVGCHKPITLVRCLSRQSKDLISSCDILPGQLMRCKPHAGSLPNVPLPPATSIGLRILSLQ